MKNAHPPIKEASALDKPHSTPNFPTHNTQAARLLAELVLGRKINPLLGWRKLGIYRLADTVLQLRKLGWSVETKRIDVRNRFGECCSVALYSLSIKEPGPDDQVLREFAAKELHAQRKKAI